MLFHGIRGYLALGHESQMLTPWWAIIRMPAMGQNAECFCNPAWCEKRALVSPLGLVCRIVAGLR